jgi:magnesium-transporting ATPase (P-type)
MKMSFWKVTMKRSVKLSKSYFAIGIMMTIYGIGLSNLMSIIPSDSANPAPIELSNSFPILSVALLSLSALFVSLPVIMLFVYDKNNGVLEYLLSTGLDQLDIFKGYVKASLALATYLLAFAITINTIIGLFLGTGLSLVASMAGLTFALGISEVLLVSVCMVAFSSLQRTPMGANQPLGVIIGIIPMFPALILPMVFPAYAVAIDLLIAAATLIASLALLFSYGRLILREKLLP